MSQSVQQQTVSVAQVQEVINNEVFDKLETAQQAAREEYGPDTVVNANLTAEDGEVNAEIQDVTDGVPDEAIHIAGVLNMPDMDIRQFTDPTIFASSSYDARDVIKTGGDEEALFSSSWVADSEWHIIPNPNHDDNPTVKEALGALVETVLNEGYPVNVSLDGAEDLLRAE
jgi:hypothetical protein